MNHWREPVAGIVCAVTVPGLPKPGVAPGSSTATSVAVPVVITRMFTPAGPKLDSAIVSEAAGVIGTGAAATVVKVCEAWSATRRTPFRWMGKGRRQPADVREKGSAEHPDADADHPDCRLGDRAPCLHASPWVRFPPLRAAEETPCSTSKI